MLIFLEKQKWIKVKREEADPSFFSASEIIIINDDDNNSGYDNDNSNESKYNFFKLKILSLNLKFV